MQTRKTKGRKAIITREGRGMRTHPFVINKQSSEERLTHS